MKLGEIVAWYQKKIGTYDKQQWERSIEQRILEGFSNTATLKAAKLKTELIDVDLVRGSTFPKAKPKQSLLTVIRYAILRYLLLPVYAKWWVKQTSPNIFGILLFLYFTQMINLAVYAIKIHPLEHYEDANQVNQTQGNTTLLEEASQIEELSVTLSDLLIPVVISFLLSLIHSQIMATNTASGIKANRRRCSNSGVSFKNPREARIRRRRKLVKNRQETTDVMIKQRKPNVTVKSFTPSLEGLPKQPITNIALHSDCEIIIPNSMPSMPFIDDLDFHSESISTAIFKLDANTATTSSALNTGSNDNDFYKTVQKKRNVNWQFPIHNFATEMDDNNDENSRQSTLAKALAERATDVDSTTQLEKEYTSSSCSSSSDNINRLSFKMEGIDKCVMQFYDDLINRTLILPAPLNPGGITSFDAANAPIAINSRRHIGEDDGFESLNGKSSSGEENISTVRDISQIPAVSNELRLRLNATDGQRHQQDATSPVSIYRRKERDSSNSDNEKPQSSSCGSYKPKHKLTKMMHNISSGNTDEEGEEEINSSPISLENNSNCNECTTSATEWLGITTNSEECSYSSDLEHSDHYQKNFTDEDGYDLDHTPTTILTSHGVADKISCTVWDRHEIKKAQMSVLEIALSVIERVETMPETNDYLYYGVFFSFFLSLVPCFYRLCEASIDFEKENELTYYDVALLLWEKASFPFYTIFNSVFGATTWVRVVLIISFLQRLLLTMILFIIFAVAERTYKHRFLYAKLFSHITSSRRARKSNLPHFRLNKVRNIKTWLSVRSYLKKRGPQRSVDVIVSAAFIVTLLLLAFLSVEWLQDSVHLHSHLNLEALAWSTTIGVFLLRFMTLGNKIHQKYRSVSVLITEQINLYLQIEQKPKKKEELMVSNSVLKLAADLLKELETPFKISGLSTNPYLFTTIKVVILSALSGVLSEMLGFKLKLHKIKIK